MAYKLYQIKLAPAQWWKLEQINLMRNGGPLSLRGGLSAGSGERAFKELAVSVQVADVIDEHLPRRIPADEFDHARISETSLLVDEVAHVDQSSSYRCDEAAAVGQPVGIAEEPQTSDALSELRKGARARDQRDPGVGRVRDVPGTRPRSGQVPVEHHRQPTLAEQCIPWRPVVVTDELVRLGSDETPSRIRWRDEAHDHVVITTEQGRGRLHALVQEDRVG